ncbi:PulJ/GspJ family protein [Polaribacter porphyrae]|nr:type II secretion system protein [Polaribacter porphyrae]
MKAKKLKAFTLAEMIVVLIVASIVIAMGFSVLNMVRKQVVTIQKNYQKKQQVLLLESLLHRDFNSNTAFYNIKNDELLLKNTRDSITYTFYENYIIRNQDTFQIEVQNKELYLDGIQVKDKVIDALEINLSENYGSKQLFVQQSKDASYYMNND